MERLWMLRMNTAPDTDHRCLLCPKFVEKVPSSTILSDTYKVENKEVLFYFPQMENYHFYIHKTSSFTWKYKEHMHTWSLRESWPKWAEYIISAENQ